MSATAGCGAERRMEERARAAEKAERGEGEESDEDDDGVGDEQEMVGRSLEEKRKVGLDKGLEMGLDRVVGMAVRDMVDSLDALVCTLYAKESVVREKGSVLFS